MKNSYISLFGTLFLLLFLTFPTSLFSFDLFPKSGNEEENQAPLIVRCDNNRLVKIVRLGKNRFQFFSVGGKNIVERETVSEVAAFVCQYYLKTS